MKKTYIAPAIVLVKTDIESNLMAGSDPSNFNGNADSKHEYEGTDVLSNTNHGATGLWVSWDDDGKEGEEDW